MSVYLRLKVETWLKPTLTWSLGLAEEGCQGQARRKSKDHSAVHPPAEEKLAGCAFTGLEESEEPGVGSERGAQQAGEAQCLWEKNCADVHNADENTRWRKVSADEMRATRGGR